MEVGYRESHFDVVHGYALVLLEPENVAEVAPPEGAPGDPPETVEADMPAGGEAQGQYKGQKNSIHYVSPPKAPPSGGVSSTWQPQSG